MTTPIFSNTKARPMIALSAPRRRSQIGLTLIEVMLGLVLLSAAAVGVFKMLDGAKVNAAVNKEQTHVEQLSDLVKSFYMNSDGDFEAISTAAVASLTGVPSEMKANGGLVSAFGSPVTIAFDAARPKEFALRYQDLSPVECLKLVTSVSQVTNRISIATDTAGTAFTQVQDDPNFDSSVTAAAAGRMKSTDVIAAQCGQAHFVAKSGVILLVFSADSDPTTTFAAVPSACVCGPTTETALNACPIGQVGAITQTRSGTCTGGTATCPSVVWGAWSTLGNTCAPIPPPPGVTPPVALPGTPCIPETQTRTLACPVGQVGTVTEAQTSSCATATSTPVWSGVWTPTTTTCVTPITPPGSVCVPTTVTDAAPPVCPVGQCGTITRQKTMVCDASNNLVAPIPDVWSVVSNTCVDAVVAGCVAAPTCVPYVSNWTSPCGVGFTGSQDMQESFTCPDPYAAPVSSGVNTVGGSCTPVAAPPAGATACSINPAPAVCTSTTEKAKSFIVLNQNRDTIQHLCSPAMNGQFHYRQSDRGGTTWNAISQCRIAASSGFATTGLPSWLPVTYASLPAADRARVDALIADHNTFLAANSYPAAGDRSAQTIEAATPDFSCLRPVIYGPTFGGVYNFAIQGGVASASELSNLSGLYGSAVYDADDWEAEMNQLFRTGSSQLSSCSGNGCYYWGGSDGTDMAYQLGLPLAIYPITSNAFVDNNWCARGNSFNTGSEGPSTPCFLGAVAACPSSAPMANCVVPASSAFAWTVGSDACGYTDVLGGTTIPHGGVYTANDSGAPTLGQAQFSCNNGVLSSTANSGATCSSPPPPPIDCNIVATPYNWTVGSSSCTFTPAAQTVAEGASISLNDITGPDTGSKSLTCTGGVLNVNSQTCSTAAANCSIADNTTFNWSVSGNTCSFIAGAQVVANGDTIVFSDTTNPTLGSAKSTCTAGSMGALSALTCTPPPPTSTSEFDCLQDTGGPSADTWSYLNKDFKGAAMLRHEYNSKKQLDRWLCDCVDGTTPSVVFTNKTATPGVYQYTGISAELADYLTNKLMKDGENEIRLYKCAASSVAPYNAPQMSATTTTYTQTWTSSNGQYTCTATIPVGSLVISGAMEFKDTTLPNTGTYYSNSWGHYGIRTSSVGEFNPTGISYCGPGT